jgi:phage shock protein A
MSKHGIIGRVTQLARADVTAIIDSADGPPQLLDRFIGDYTATIADAERAIAQLIDNLHVAEDDQQQDAKAAAEWGKEAAAASQMADELRAAGEAVEADRFDNLALVALERQMIAESDVAAGQHTVAAQAESVGKLKDGLDQMTMKLAELRRTQHSSLTRPHSARRPDESEHAIMSLDIMDPRSEVGRFELQVRREEMRARGAQAPRASAVDAQFARLDNLGNRAELGERLKALKAGRAMAAAKAKVQAQARDQPFR